MRTDRVTKSDVTAPTNQGGTQSKRVTVGLYPMDNEPPNIGRLITSIEIIKNHFIFLVGTLGGSRKKMADFTTVERLFAKR